MYRVIVYIALAILVSSVQKVAGQIKADSTNIGYIEKKIELLEFQKQQVIKEEKEKLKIEVQRITDLENKGKISKELAQKEKEAAARTAALNIENKTSIIDNKIALLQRGEDIDTEVDFKDDGYSVAISIGDDVDEYYQGWFNLTCKGCERVYDRRTYSDLILAFGLNHGLIDGVSFNDSPYKVGGSKFFELGWQWKTRLFKNSNAVRLSYGISYQSNGIKVDDNRYFVKNGDVTELEDFDGSIKKAKLRMDNLVVPVFFEFGPSKRIDREDYFRYSTRRKLVFGVGGYAGLNMGTRQKLKYSRDGDSSKDKVKRNYNTNNFIYGIAGYIGVGDVSLYAKYDLNPMFKDPNIDQHNISLGLRFEL